MREDSNGWLERERGRETVVMVKKSTRGRVRKVLGGNLMRDSNILNWQVLPAAFGELSSINDILDEDDPTANPSPALRPHPRWRLRYRELDFLTSQEYVGNALPDFQPTHRSLAATSDLAQLITI